jgi:hypothetical protein
MRSLRSFIFVLAASAGIASACTLIDATYRTDTIATGTVQVVQTNWTYNYSLPAPPYRVEAGQLVHGPYRQTDLTAHLTGVIRDSALVFIARIDSLVSDSTVSLAPEIVLTPTYSGAGAVFAWVRARVNVDTVLRGSLPAKQFWIKTHYLNSAACGTTWDHLLNKKFLNASAGLFSTTDIKLPYGGSSSSYYFNAAYWFDGRNLVAPGFPGLRTDITTILPEYPATSIRSSGLPKRPLRDEAKVWKPDGRVAPSDESSRRKTSVPLLK